MTHKQRFLNMLDRQPVDLLPYGDGLWTETKERYIREGHLREGDDPVQHFDMSYRFPEWMSSVADMDFQEQILEETDETVLKLNGNGAKLRWFKKRSGTPEHVDFIVQDRAGWEKLIKPHLTFLDRRRLPFEKYRKARKQTADEGRAFAWGGIAPFEQMHPVCGHEYLLMGMALDPDWVKDMVMTYADFTIRHQDTLFREEGLPDVFWFYEDLGFKEKPFMSPAMYEEILEPGHKKLFDYAHSLGRKVIVHSCGFVEPLVPGLVRAGMDCLQAMEVKAGMDMLRLARQFGEKITFCGNIDIRIIASNDHRKIDEELRSKVLPVLKMGGGFIVRSDHTIPPDVDYDTLRYFFEQGSRLAKEVWGL